MAFSYGSYYGRGVDPRLEEILRLAAEGYDYNVEAFSGRNKRSRGTRWHPGGIAVDVNLVDPKTGKALSNYQSGSTFRQYEDFAQRARRIQQERYPELSSRLRWGGYFSGKKGKYGALDLMHFDLGGGRAGMQGGSWQAGLTPAQQKLFPQAVSIGMNMQGPMPVDQANNQFQQMASANTPGGPSQSGPAAPPSGSDPTQDPMYKAIQALIDKNEANQSSIAPDAATPQRPGLLAQLFGKMGGDPAAAQGFGSKLSGVGKALSSLGGEAQPLPSLPDAPAQAPPPQVVPQGMPAGAQIGGLGGLNQEPPNPSQMASMTPDQLADLEKLRRQGGLASMFM